MHPSFNESGYGPATITTRTVWNFQSVNHLATYYIIRPITRLIEGRAHVKNFMQRLLSPSLQAWLSLPLEPSQGFIQRRGLWKGSMMAISMHFTYLRPYSLAKLTPYSLHMWPTWVNLCTSLVDQSGHSGRAFVTQRNACGWEMHITACSVVTSVCW